MRELRISGANFEVLRAPADPQVLFHCEPADASAIAEATGLSLPAVMLTSARANGWNALHLSPDEWLLIGEANARDLEPLFAGASGRFALSLVDVSERSLSIDIGGTDPAQVLNGACPLDFARFGAGACTRTLFGKITVMLWRRENAIRMSYPRSFDDYVVALLTAVAADRDEGGG